MVIFYILDHWNSGLSPSPNIQTRLIKNWVPFRRIWGFDSGGCELKINRCFGQICRKARTRNALLRVAFLLGLFFRYEDDGDMLLRNVGSFLTATRRYIPEDETVALFPSWDRNAGKNLLNDGLKLRLTDTRFPTILSQEENRSSFRYVAFRSEWQMVEKVQKLSNHKEPYMPGKAIKLWRPLSVTTHSVSYFL
jgi:hypothetical protein